MIFSTTKLVYELPNNWRLRILEIQEILKKSQIRVEKQPSTQSPFHEVNFSNSNYKTRKNKYQTFLVLSNFTEFLYCVPKTFPRIADIKTINVSELRNKKTVMSLESFFFTFSPCFWNHVLCDPLVIHKYFVASQSKKKKKRLMNLVIRSDNLIISALQEWFLKLKFPRGRSYSVAFLSILCISSCVCIFMLFLVKASSVCHYVWDIHECTDQRSCVVRITLSPFAKILHLCF